MRVSCFHDKTDECATLVGWSENTHSGQFRETVRRITSKICVVFENCRTPDPLDVIDSGGEPNRAGDVGRAGFKSVGGFLERAFFQSSATGLIVPREFEMCVKAKSFTSGVSSEGS